MVQSPLQIVRFVMLPNSFFQTRRPSRFLFEGMAATDIRGSLNLVEDGFNEFLAPLGDGKTLTMAQEYAFRPQLKYMPG